MPNLINEETIEVGKFDNYRVANAFFLGYDV